MISCCGLMIITRTETLNGFLQSKIRGGWSYSYASIRNFTKSEVNNHKTKIDRMIQNKKISEGSKWSFYIDKKAHNGQAQRRVPYCIESNIGPVDRSLKTQDIHLICSHLVCSYVGKLTVHSSRFPSSLTLHSLFSCLSSALWAKIDDVDFDYITQRKTIINSQKITLLLLVVLLLLERSPLEWWLSTWKIKIKIMNSHPERRSTWLSFVWW